MKQVSLGHLLSDIQFKSVLGKKKELINENWIYKLTDITTFWIRNIFYMFSLGKLWVIGGKVANTWKHADSYKVWNETN